MLNFLFRVPGNYQRKSTRHSWSKKHIVKTIQSVTENKVGWLKASRAFNVPRAPIRRHFVNVPVNIGRFKATFESVVEKELLEHLLDFKQIFFEVTTTEVRKSAFKFGKKAEVSHRFGKDADMTGWDWIKGLRRRNPYISLWAP